MPKQKKKKSPPPLPATTNRDDPRPSALFHIAWFTLAMLGMCIPLSPILGQFVPWTAPALPVLIIACSILCSIAVWTSDERQSLEQVENENEFEMESLKGEVRTLNERLEALETIHAFEARNDLRTGVITDSGPPRSSSESGIKREVSV